MPTARTEALSLLMDAHAPRRILDHHRLQFADNVQLLSALRGSLTDARRHGDARSVARLAPLIAARTDRMAAIYEQTGASDLASMTDEELEAELVHARLEDGWLPPSG